MSTLVPLQQRIVSSLNGMVIKNAWSQYIRRTFNVIKDIPLLWDSKAPNQTLGTRVEGAVCLVIADGHFNLAQGFLYVCMR